MKIEKAIQVLKKPKIISIDVGVNESSYFFCTMGVGLDAQIGHKFEKQGKRGFIGYIVQVYKIIKKYKPKKYILDIDGKKIQQKATLITIANAPQWGNNAYISPEADIRDGYLDVCILTPFPWIKALPLAIRLFNGTIDNSKYLAIYRARNIVLKRTKKKKRWIHVDGEPKKTKKKIRISIIPKGLNVIVPFSGK
jgi:diacylglycerol kinase family enzyme